MNMEEKYNKLLYWFREISKVPRNSTKEEKIAEFLCGFAQKRNLSYRRDDLYNVVINKKASSGWESKDPIILQAHTDMVCEKTFESTHDFEKDGIEIIETLEKLTAKDTTLGADDGIGVATLLLMLDDEEIMHPEIYCLFTTQEEIGMDGAKFFDYSDINATYLINVDGEEENTAIVGCAGGVRVQYEKNVECTKEKNIMYKMVISGLYGGHSGVDIDKKRINSNFLTAKILSKLDNLKIASFIGGNKDNAIPNYTEVVFYTTSTDVKEVATSVVNQFEIVDEDRNLKVDIELISSPSSMCLTEDESQHLISLLINIKQGVIEYSKDVNGLVETSGNVGIVNVSNGKAKITELIRSSDDDKKEIVKDSNNNLAKKYEYSIFENSSYPGWKYTPNTKIEEAYIEAYREVHDSQKPIICAIHAGVECGMIYKKMPHLQMISIGPDLTDVHTVNETLHLDSCRKFLNTLIRLIEKL